MRPSSAVRQFYFTSADGTRVRGWRNGGEGLPVLLSNGLGTPPEAWPTVVRPDNGFRVCTWYYRGTGGGDRPADPTRISVDDHVEDAIALLDHEGVERALVACWSLGVNVGFELARRHPERVAGLLAVAGVPGGTFRAMGAPLRIPRRFRHDVGVAAARLGRFAGPGLSWLAQRVPLNSVTASLINHTGFVLPAAKPDRLIPALAEFRRHDFRWYFTLAIAASEHEPMDLSFVEMPATLIAGRYDVLTSMHDMVEAAARIPHAELKILPGSHFLPLEFPDEIAGHLGALAGRTDLASGLTA